jgi:hypothetical protein
MKRLAGGLALVAALGVVGGIAVTGMQAGAQAGNAAVDPGPRPYPQIPGIVVLFSGREEDIAKNWHWYGSDRPAGWRFVDGAMETRMSDIESNQKFQDFQLHVEWREPDMPNAHGQEKGNSGVFLHGHYEIQVLDSYGKSKPGTGDCAALYDRAAALLPACRPALVWQTYDIVFRAPRYDGATMVEKGRVSVFQNGVAVQNNTVVEGPTDGSNASADFSQPVGIRLQFHNNTVRFRNVWVLPLPEKGNEKYE